MNGKPKPNKYYLMTLNQHSSALSRLHRTGALTIPQLTRGCCNRRQTKQESASEQDLFPGHQGKRRDENLSRLELFWEKSISPDFETLPINSYVPAN